MLAFSYSLHRNLQVYTSSFAFSFRCENFCVSSFFSSTVLLPEQAPGAGPAAPYKKAITPPRPHSNFLLFLPLYLMARLLSRTTAKKILAYRFPLTPKSSPKYTIIPNSIDSPNFERMSKVTGFKFYYLRQLRRVV